MDNIEISATTPNVKLLDMTQDPIFKLWLAFRTCYSPNTPQQLFDRPVDADEMLEFVERRMRTAHTSPLEHVNFTFAISGVSRVFSHQLVRHRAGVSVAQQSGRYTDPIELGVFQYVHPKSATFDGTHGTSLTEHAFKTGLRDTLIQYQALVQSGVPREDARFILPGCQATNMVITINFAALLHMADLRLCTAAQWEYRKVMALMRAEVKRSSPELAQYIGPKCLANRRAMCDEDLKTYTNCPLSAMRPHRSGFSPMAVRDPDEATIEAIQ